MKRTPTRKSVSLSHMSHQGVRSVVECCARNGVKLLKMKDLYVEFYEPPYGLPSKTPSHVSRDMRHHETSSDTLSETHHDGDELRSLEERADQVSIDLEELLIRDPSSWEEHCLSSDHVPANENLTEEDDSG